VLIHSNLIWFDVVPDLDQKRGLCLMVLFMTFDFSSVDWYYLIFVCKFVCLIDCLFVSFVVCEVCEVCEVCL